MEEAENVLKRLDKHVQRRIRVCLRGLAVNSLVTNASWITHHQLFGEQYEISGDSSF